MVGIETSKARLSADEDRSDELLMLLYIYLERYIRYKMY